MYVPIIKASIAGITSGVIGKFYSKMDNGESMRSGVITAGSVIITDTVFSLSSMLPKFFSFLGYYALDFASSLLDAGIRWLVRNNSAMTWTATNGSFLTDFLVSLGSTVIAGYANTPIKKILPSGGTLLKQ